MGELSPWHWIIVLLIFGLLFGSRKLPDAARGLGRSMRIFKAEMQGAQEDAAAPAAATAPAPAPAESTDTAAPAVAAAAGPVAADPFQTPLTVQDAVPIQDAVPEPVADR